MIRSAPSANAVRIIFAPYLAEHLQQLGPLHPMMVRYADRLRDPAVAAALAMPGLSWSGFCAGRMVGCAGIMPVWPGRATAWAIFGDAIPLRAWPAITAKVKEICEQAHREGWHRIETTVLVEFPAAYRWAERCGFVCEAYLQAYGPDGADHWQFGRVDRKRSRPPIRAA